MSRFRVLAIGILSIAALTATAQQTTAGTDTDNQHNVQGVPTVDQHLKVLSEKLNLTSDQQAKAKPILQEMQDSMLKVSQDTSLTHEERMDKVRPLREKADKQLREILTDEQKQKLDQLEHEPHSNLHG